MVYRRSIFFSLVFLFLTQLLVCSRAYAQGIRYMDGDTLDAVYQGIGRRSVHQFYRQRGYMMFWTNSQLGSNSTDSLIDLIRTIRYDGLLPEFYHMPELELLMQTGLRNENAQRFEALLTDSFILLVKHTRFGKTVSGPPTADSLGIALLEEVSRQGGVKQRIYSLEPTHIGYRSLKRALRALIDSLPPIDKQLLMSNAVVSSQSVVEQITKIELNLERWRLERVCLGDRYIWINIPEFTAYVCEHDSVVFSSRVIVGKPDKQTPELSSTIHCIITYPYWHVPRKIAVEEYLPLIKQDVNFLEQNRFDVLDGNGNMLRPDTLPWAEFSRRNFPVRLRQREGSDNALGIVKFDFDNSYGVYLHDTNAPGLFRKNVRAFSHGCIRMEKALEFSHYLVVGDWNSRSKDLDRYYSRAIRHAFLLKRPISIYVRYFTCDATQGSIRYYPDVYRKDSRLYERFYKGESKRALGSNVSY